MGTKSSRRTRPVLVAMSSTTVTQGSDFKGSDYKARIDSSNASLNRDLEMQSLRGELERMELEKADAISLSV